MTSFIQITDTHIVPEGQLAYGVSDTEGALRRAVAAINARLPFLGPVDCVVVTGDLTDHGTAGDYQRFRAIMADLDVPYQAIPGNHDRRDAMRTAFAGEAWMPGEGPIQWRRDFGPYTMLALDSLDEGDAAGRLSDEGFTFLDAELARLNGKPLVIATHHPWMLSGLSQMDGWTLKNGDKLMNRLEEYPGPVRMISGHVHRAMTTQIGKVTCQIAPSTCHAVYSDHRTGANSRIALEAGAFTLFSWHDGPAGGLISDIIPTADLPDPGSFDG